MTLAERLAGRRVGVALSSAFFGFYAHIGFMRALRDAGVEVAALGGTSAGAMTAAFAAAGDVEPFAELVTSIRRKDFWDPRPWAGRPAALLAGRRFMRLLEDNLPVDTFEACHTPLVVVTTDLTNRRRHVDTTGPLAESVMASCALPLMFRPVQRGDTWHCDGGLLDKAPISAMIDHTDVDTMLVHMIPSSGMDRPLARSPMRFLDQALDWVRDDGWRQQAALARARGIDVHVITTNPPRPNPFKMERGLQAMSVAEAQTLEALRAGV